MVYLGRYSEALPGLTVVHFEAKTVEFVDRMKNEERAYSLLKPIQGI
jgi:hypothetical protein